MSDSRIYARFVTIISDYLGRKEVAIEFTGLLSRVIQESIFKTTGEKLKSIR